MTLPIAGERLILWRFTHDDVPGLRALVADPSVARAAPEIGTTDGEIHRYIDAQNALQPFEPGKTFDLAVERKEDGRVIGLVTLVCKEHRQGAIGYALGADHRGQGYATEAAGVLMAYAFTVLGLHRIQADTSAGNVASWKVMERLGMRPEGHLREAGFDDGQWVDLLVYGLLAGEWHERTQGP
jgi:RimJ/RimL family protein N-acetyltransferase